MKASPSFLALDLGAESGRAIVGTFADRRLALKETRRFDNTPLSQSSGLHWDASRLWSEIKAGIAASASEFSLEGLALDTWGVDFGLLDKDGVLLDNPYHYRDSRTDGMLEEAFRRVPREQIFAQTGIQFMQINTLYQLLSMSIAKSPLLDAARTFLTMPDLFNYWLSGKYCSEFTDRDHNAVLRPTAQDLGAVPC